MSLLAELKRRNVSSVWCACGSPFDLEATPNFAGLQWLPAAPIHYALMTDGTARGGP